MLDILTLTGGVITTASVQAAIDRAAAERQALVFPAGVYTVTALTLPSHSSLLLEDGAVIQASPNSEDWRDCDRKPLISAIGACNVTLSGGTLHCSGKAFMDAAGRRNVTPYFPTLTVYMRDCRDIAIQNITLTQTVAWTCHLDNCENVLLEKVIIRNPPWNQSQNSDGIDLNGCRHAVVRYCDVETGDDAICLKNADNGAPRKDMFDIRVHDCRVATTCNATKIGTETHGNIYDVVFENITVQRHPAIQKDGPGNPTREMVNPLSAISVQSNDGASVHDITFRNYQVEHALTPLFIILQPRNRFSPDVHGEMYNIAVENVKVTTSYRNSAILAAENMCIRNVRLSNITARNCEKPAAEYVSTVPTGKEYPDIFHFPPFPAYGLFARNAEVTVENCSFCEVADSGRPEMDIH